jgi:membrane associated rhomboid family serine protease
MNDITDFEPAPPASPPALPLPLHKPFFTYVLMGLVIAVWLAMLLAGGSQNSDVLRLFGANDGVLILRGQTWRLFTSMFVHVSLAHLFFNTYALYIFGLEMERLYGPDRFIIIYILSGLFGSLVSFASRGPYVLSAGASGAIFGIVGMNLAFFLTHRHTFGSFGRSRIMNTLVIIGINLFLGFSIPNIDNLAHLGGLVSGFAMGYGLAPRYDIADRYTLTPQVIDTISLFNRWWVPGAAMVALSGGVWAALSFWGNM